MLVSRAAHFVSYLRVGFGQVIISVSSALVTAWLVKRNKT